MFQAKIVFEHLRHNIREFSLPCTPDGMPILPSKGDRVFTPVGSGIIMRIEWDYVMMTVVAFAE